MQPYDAPPAKPAEGDPDIWSRRPGAESNAASDPATEAVAQSGRKKGKPLEQGGDGSWERGVLENLANTAVREQRARRRWRIFFTLIVMAYIGFITWTLMGNTVLDRSAATPHTAVVRIEGVIANDSEASARYLYRSLRDAFEAENAKAVLLSINSPGGSPVQAGIVRDEIVRLKAKHNKPVYAVIGDAGASAAYYIAVAADDIYVDKASLVGRIGVLLNGFGFTGTMELLGVERRLITSGESKGFMDPFSPQQPADIAHSQRLLKQIHQQFIDVVREGRGARLNESANVFTGLVWSGEEAVTLGLADHMGSIYSVARDVVQEEKIVDYTRRRSLADQIPGRLGSSLGLGIGQGAVQQMQGEALSWR